ncbi:MAG TPA: phage baseplate assembly protein V [Anaerolineae bacterium]|nr:phage baseplate assembly protein V [Anaerolineae bacterium]HMR64196.1 phage baseplate assembly protein V [Anaerolineae bacterium]
MSLNGATFNGFLPAGPLTGQGGHFYGVYTALVTDVQDPDGQGRVRLRLPWATDPDGAAYETWARLATLMAGAERGTWFIPEPDDEVLVAFEAGDPRAPIVVGALWNGVDSPPQEMDSNNNIRSITSRSGIRVTFDDTDGGVQFSVETPGGQKIVCADSPASIDLSDSNGNQVTLDSAGITLNTGMNVTINATLLKVSASMVTVDAGMSRFSGVVQSDTNITNTTVSATYTPGAGNIW